VEFADQKYDENEKNIAPTREKGIELANWGNNCLKIKKT
jgi:hypothetical protein